jgi:ADP-ribosylglycohydrolase
MAVAGPILKDRFEGCLLGLAVGDALGGKFEAQSADAIRARFPSAGQLIAYPQEEIWYTDDTQMAIGVCEALIERGEIVEEALCRAFVANYLPARGYGRGARRPGRDGRWRRLQGSRRATLPRRVVRQRRGHAGRSSRAALPR